MDLEGLIKEHDAIFAKLQPLRDKQREISQLRRERDSLNNKVKLLNTEIKALQKERDTFNKQVQTHKSTRNELNERTKKIRDSYQEVFDQRKDTNFRELEQKVKSINWKIQTAGVSFKEEKKLRNQLESLEKVYNAKKVLRDSKKEAETKHRKVLEYSARSEEVHEELVKLYARVKDLREDADVKHEEVITAVKVVEALNAEHADDIKRKEDIKTRIVELKKETKEKREEEKQASAKERAKEAMELFSAGKRVDLRDLQLSFGLDGDAKETPKTKAEKKGVSELRESGASKKDKKPKVKKPSAAKKATKTKKAVKPKKKSTAKKKKIPKPAKK